MVSTPATDFTPIGGALVSALRILSALVAFVLGALILYAGEPSVLRWWMVGLPLALWVIGPAVAPCLVANRRSRPWLSITMLLYLAVSSIVSGFAYDDAFFRSKSSTAALTLVFIPLYQWLALAPLLVVCAAIRRRRSGPTIPQPVTHPPASASGCARPSRSDQ